MPLTAYGKPLVVGLPAPTNLRGYGGLFTAITTGESAAASNQRDYGLAIYVHNLLGWNLYLYESVFDWNRWHGDYRVVGNQMRLSLEDAAAQATLTDLQTYLRFGQTGTMVDTVHAERSATVESFGVAGFGLDGDMIRFRQPNSTYNEGNNFSFLRMPGPAAEYEIVSEYGVGQFGFGAWLKWGPNSTTPPYGHILGFNFVYFRPYEPYGGYRVRELYQGRVYCDAQAGGRLRIVFSRLREDVPDSQWTHLGAFHTTIPLSLLPVAAGSIHHFYFQIRIESQSGKQVLTGELMIDGSLILKSIQPQDYFYDYTYGIPAAHQNIPNGAHDTVEISTGGYKAPALGGFSYTNAYNTAQNPGWSTEMASSPWNASIDDVFISRQSIFVPGTAIPKTQITPSSGEYQWNTSATPNGAWQDGLGKVFQPTRHANLTQLGESSDRFVLYGPVEQTSRGPSSGITRLRVKFSQGLQAGRVYASVRASTVPFSWNANLPQWSEWNDFTRFSDTLRRIGGGGAGPYVQVRLKVLPSSDPLHLYSPSIQSVYFETGEEANPENNVPTVPGTSYMWVNSQDSINEVVLVSRYPAGAHQLSWSLSTDADVDDLPYLTYHLQVSRTNTFEMVDLLVNQDRITSNEFLMPTDLAPGAFYWRVRAFDDRQYSNWSSVAAFRVNRPPAAPYDLAVIQIS